jgi:hypothetical protein
MIDKLYIMRLDLKSIWVGNSAERPSGRLKAFLPDTATRTELKEEILDDSSGYWAALPVVRHERRY